MCKSRLFVLFVLTMFTHKTYFLHNNPSKIELNLTVNSFKNQGNRGSWTETQSPPCSLQEHCASSSFLLFFFSWTLSSEISTCRSLPMNPTCHVQIPSSLKSACVSALSCSVWYYWLMRFLGKKLGEIDKDFFFLLIK